MKIEAGPDMGKIIPQFQPLGLEGLVLVGSIVHDYCYTVFQYEVVECSSTVVSLGPVGVWLFNKPGGPAIISGRDRLPGRVAIKQGRTRFKAYRASSKAL